MEREINVPFGCVACYEDLHPGAHVCGAPLSTHCDKHLLESLALFREVVAHHAEPTGEHADFLRDWHKRDCEILAELEKEVQTRKL
jgi:hypothetical protein